jgi:hypothetical protein
MRKNKIVGMLILAGGLVWPVFGAAQAFNPAGREEALLFQDRILERAPWLAASLVSSGGRYEVGTSVLISG